MSAQQPENTPTAAFSYDSALCNATLRANAIFNPHVSPDCWCGDPDHFKVTVFSRDLPEAAVVTGESDGRRVLMTRVGSWHSFGFGNTDEEALGNLLAEVNRHA